MKPIDWAFVIACAAVLIGNAVVGCYPPREYAYAYSVAKWASIVVMTFVALSFTIAFILSRLERC